ncbi:hypothetical protein KOM00_01955 [Geomonas sp. Red69]|uniref:hypothetical protein n=1 Tax=Geomonas diazotrophica TaxID=2843197 RepID=UPI001C0FDC60|nr:hypothetical protein [Geomonas diazotrophica]MBU5635490.1 hypothetical protein [Geomonas diazotrophica]
MTLSTEDFARIRQIIREELTAAKRRDDGYQDQAYLVATTTPQERNQMARVKMQAQRAAQKAAKAAKN